MIKKISFLLLSVCFVVLLFGCERKEDGDIYVCEEDGYAYTLTIANDVFVLVRKNGEGEEETFSGTCKRENGAYVLTGEGDFSATVLPEENSFSFLADFIKKDDGEKEPEKKDCSHEWNAGVYYEPEDCLKKGKTVYTCGLCGEERTVYASATGKHNLKETVVKGATCLVRDKKVRYCTLCDYKEEEELPFASDAHKYLPTGETDGADCLHRVKMKYVCAYCKKTITQEPIGETPRIGEHAFDENGLCKKCGYYDNGFSVGHTDLNKDGKCDGCGEKMTVLTDMAKKGYATDGDIVYFGVFPQKRANIDVETLQKEGRYDLTGDRYYYKNEAYVVAKCVSDVTFGDGTAKKRGDLVAFVLTPIAWEKTKSGSYISKAILEGRKYTDEVYLYTTEGGAVFSRIGGGKLANGKEGSSLIKSLSAEIEKAMPLMKRESVVFEGLPEETKEENAEKRATDYALSSGLTATDGIASWYLARSQATTEENGKYVSYVTLTGETGKSSVTALRGVVPLITLKSDFFDIEE